MSDKSEKERIGTEANFAVSTERVRAYAGEAKE